MMAVGACAHGHACVCACVCAGVTVHGSSHQPPHTAIAASGNVCRQHSFPQDVLLLGPPAIGSAFEFKFYRNIDSRSVPPEVFQRRSVKQITKDNLQGTIRDTMPGTLFKYLGEFPARNSGRRDLGACGPVHSHTIDDSSAPNPLCWVGARVGGGFSSRGVGGLCCSQAMTRRRFALAARLPGGGQPFTLASLALVGGGTAVGGIRTALLHGRELCVSVRTMP